VEHIRSFFVVHQYAFVITNVSLGEMSGINIALGNGTIASINDQCTRVLVYPDQVYVSYLRRFFSLDTYNWFRLKGFVREDVVLMVVEFYQLCMIFIVIVYESRAHL
jgi:hypothetical protein